MWKSACVGVYQLLHCHLCKNVGQLCWMMILNITLPPSHWVMVCDAVGWGFHLLRDINFGFAHMSISHKQIVYLLLSTCVKFMMKFVCLIKLHSTNYVVLAGSCRDGRSSSCLKSVVNVCLIKVCDTMQNVGGIFRTAVTVLMFSGVQIILAILRAIFKVVPVSLKF